MKKTVVHVVVSALLSFSSMPGLQANEGSADLSGARIRAQASLSLERILTNLDHPAVRPGAVIASPSRANPDYFYHWVRDAALVMDSVRQAYEASQDAQERARLWNHLMQWVEFERKIQRQPNLSGGPGEPKYNVDGTAWSGEWGRPQNDGPAARAITLIRLANLMIREGRLDEVRSKLYTSRLPAESPIKFDLEYTAHQWRATSFDLWEEVRGHHFYTRMLQRRALVLGADLARRLGDVGAADFYAAQAQALTTELRRHANAKLGLLEPTLDRDAGWDHKFQSLDVAIVLGALHADGDDGFFGSSNEWVLASAEKLENAFDRLYPLNQQTIRSQRQDAGDLAPAIGRYPEDVYDGVGFSGGNPWFLATLAYAELHCRAAAGIEAAPSYRVTRLAAGLLGKSMTGKQSVLAGAVLRRDDPRTKQLTQALRARAEGYFRRVLRHTDEKGSLYEQFQRRSGYLTAAPHLSWSYASYVTAHLACFDRL